MKTNSFCLLLAALLSATAAHSQSPLPTFRQCSPIVSAPSGDMNYVLTRVFRISGVNTTNLSATRTTCEENQTVQYFDALGRVLQTVSLQTSPSGLDVVQPHSYDIFGREQLKYQPYTASANGGAFRAGALQPGSGLDAFYVSPPAGIKSTGSPYSLSIFDSSPLNRLIEQGAPGDVWQPRAISQNGHAIQLDYKANAASEVWLWNVNPAGNGAIGSGYYPEATLFKEIKKNENWKADDGLAGTTEEFKDMNGRVVLKRIWETSLKSASTYYIYDDMGDLRYVLPPEVNENGASVLTSFDETQAVFKNFVYGYRYDGARRMTEKKIPGKGWQHMVYNNLDQVVLSQDQMMRAAGKWLFTKYDELGRVIVTGIFESDETRAELQQTADGYEMLWETRDNTNLSGANTGYTCVAFPEQTSITDYYSISYYDDYGFYGNSFGGATGNQATGTLTRGLLTGLKTNVLGSASLLLAVSYYDENGRTILTRSANHRGGVDIVENTWSFVGELTASVRKHTGSASGPETIIADRYEYDHVGRSIASFQKINNQDEVVLSRQTYNELGQLGEKSLHSRDGVTFVQHISYTYNERGWLTGINSPTGVTTDRVFGMQIDYANKPDAFNGNIGSVSWQTMVPPGLGLAQHVQGFTYDYDKLDRLIKADYGNANITAKFNEELTYDNMGNILTLKRMNSSGYLNDLGYSYLYNGQKGNLLSSVADQGTGGKSSAFTYDDNGSQKTNSRLGITNIEYNYLNLPKMITKGGTGEMLIYTYSASGIKLRKQLGSQVTDYLDGIQYSGSTIDFIQTQEGRAIPGSSYTYEYFLKDQLGNTRAVVKQDGSIVQVQDYYAFGLEMDAGNQFMGSPANHYKYNGKEKQQELGLDQLDYGARFYDPVVGRWNVVDAKSELYFNWSPYTYALNTPTNAIDPNGHLVIFINGNHYGDGGKIDYWQKRENVTRYKSYSLFGQTLWSGSETRSEVTQDFAGAVMNQLDDYHDKYVDGAGAGMKGWHGLTTLLSPGLSGIGASDRQESGYSRGKEDAAAIIESLHRSGGVIDESIKVITHSMGGAYGKGYVRAILDYAKDNKIAGVTIAYEADFAPFQPNQQKAVKGVNTFQFSHSKDDFAGNDPMSGAMQMDTKSDKSQGHSIHGFFNQIQNLPAGKYKIVGGKIVSAN